jgi:threonine dehydrogenase-like Zn-dependent dehydrogenase
MKTLVLEKYNELIFKDVKDPEISADEVLIKVKACGICGSDVQSRKTEERIWMAENPVKKFKIN